MANQPASYDSPIICTVATKEDIWQAAIQLKNGKAVGPDDIAAEPLKVDIETSVEMLHEVLCIKIYWKKGYLIKLSET